MSQHIHCRRVHWHAKEISQYLGVPNSVPSGAIIDTPEVRISLRGSLVRTFLDTGSLVTSQNILRPRDGGFLARVLEPGTRAISIKVDAESGVSGLIWPGDYVDVVLTQVIERQTDKPDSQIAQNARRAKPFFTMFEIVAIDQEIVQGGATNNATAGKVVQTVSLQLAPEQVNKITVAEQLGKLSLAVRSAVDHRLQRTLALCSAAMCRRQLRRRQSATVVGNAGDKVKEYSVIAGETVMSANIAVVSPPEETTSVVTRNRIVCFVNDDLSAAALRKGLEGSNLEVKHGTIRNAIRMLETDTELFALVADISGIDDPFTELERLSGVCPPDVRVALIGESRDISFTARLWNLAERVPSEAAHARYGAKPATPEAAWRRGARSDRSWRTCDFDLRCAGGRRSNEYRYQSRTATGRDHKGQGRTARPSSTGRRNSSDVGRSAWARAAHRSGKPDAGGHAVPRTRGN